MTIINRFVFTLLARSLRLGLILALLPAPALAQDAAGTVLITAIDTARYPDVSVYLSVHDREGRHVAGLTRAAFALAENGAPVAELASSEEQVGVQVVFALDPTAAFKARDANGVTRLDFVIQALADFAETAPWMRNGVDDVTVLTPEGVLLTHSTTGAEVARALSRYATEFAGAADPLPLVNQALDYASDATARPGMRRSVILVSNGLTSAPLEDLAARATTAQIPIHTVWVGPAGAENTVGAVNLGRLSSLTGGAHVVFERPASLTPLFERLADQGTQYRLGYRSALAVTGQHSLTAQVLLAEGVVVSSNEGVFPLRIEAPAVALPNVPPTIQRTLPASGTDPQTAQPAAVEVPVAVEFPDGHPRGLRQAQLLADGVPVATVSEPSANLAGFTWPLANYVETGTHVLQARVTDELGLIAESALVTVTVALEIPAVPAAAANAPTGTRSLIFVGIGLLLAMNVAVGGWYLYARRGRARRARAPVDTAPLILPPSETASKPRVLPRLIIPSLHLPGRPARPKPRGKAYLEVLEPGGGGAPHEDIEILTPTLHLGRDAALVEVVFHDRSVSRHHAYIEESADGVYTIFDEGSTSGTWVNFVQIPAETGCKLGPGDVINLGRVQLRFRRREAPGPDGSPPGDDHGAPLSPAG